jgi:phosphoribosyl 1,2-cyclic phosphodiesterase
MPLQFAVLASGSRGNATLVKAGGAGLLVDFGIGPRAIERRLAAVGAGWGDVHAVVLTHTHGDHIDSATLGRIARHGVPLYCHEGHLGELRRMERFPLLDGSGLLRIYDDRPFLTPDGLRVEPIELSHDGGPTFGFRFEGRAARGARPVALGYLADTGLWSANMADALGDVDLLGVEFNHDVEMQRRSGRSPYLIARNLGNRGHLSNDQGAALIGAVLGRSAPGGLRHVVLLHLSQQCNRPDLALQVARAAIRGAGRRVSVHAAEQGIASPNLLITPRRGRIRRPLPEFEQAELPF